MNFADIMNKAGIAFIDRRVAGRPGSFAPIGVINHHTAGGIAGGPTASLNTVIKGRADLTGPLCNLYISREPKLYLISDGRANHAGLGAANVLDATSKQQPPPLHGPDSKDGNTNYIGIEVENNGTGEPYNGSQLDLLFRVDAALCKALGKNQNVVIHHKEWTRRKNDMSWGGDLRGEVAKRLNPPPPPVQPPYYLDGLLEGQKVKVTPISIKTDNSGNGWDNSNGIPFNKHLGVEINAPYPPDNGYLPIPRIGAQMRDGKTCVVVEGAIPNATVDVRITSVD